MKESLAVKIVFWTLIINFIIESFLMYFDNRITIFIIQYIFNICILVLIFLYGIKFRFSKLYIPPLILTTYFLIMSAFSSNVLLSYHMVLKFSIPFAYLIIGYSLKSLYLIKYLLNKIWVILLYFVVYFVLVNYFEIGQDLYVGGVKVGYFSISGLYVPTFSLVIVLFMYRLIDTRKKRILTIFLSILTTLIFVAILKRTLIITFVVAVLAYLLFYFNYKQVLKAISFSILAMVLFFSFFYEGFQKTFQSRESRFSKDYNIREEGRFSENIYTYDLIKNDPLKLIFGYGDIFNDRDYLSFNYYEDEREIHNSFARILWNGGFLGLFIYLLFYYYQFKLSWKSYLLLKPNQFTYKLLFTFLITFIILRFLNDFSSGATYLCFNSLSYLIIGNILTHNYQNKRKIIESHLKFHSKAIF